MSFLIFFLFGLRTMHYNLYRKLYI